MCTTSSGTSFDAATTSSWVAGQVSTRLISSSNDDGTPEAAMMWGCWPRYWVTSSRAASRAASRSGESEQTTSWGRSMSSTPRPARSAPVASAAMALALYPGDTR
jgi:hypothetical protein